MKKRVFILFSILIVLSLSLIDIKALENPLKDEVDKLEDGKTKFENLKENITSEQFLKEEWGKLFRKTKTTGAVISFFEKISPVTNPLVKYTIGKEPSLSYLFILMCFIWFGILIFILQGMDLVSLFSGKTKWIMALGATIISGVSGVIESFANGIILILNTLGIWWVKIVVAICAIMIFAFSQKISESLSNYLKKKRKEKKDETNREKINQDIKILETFTEAVTKD